MSKSDHKQTTYKQKPSKKVSRDGQPTYATSILTSKPIPPLLTYRRTSTHTEGERNRLESKYASQIKEEKQLSRFVGFMGNREVPLLRLFRFKEAFSLHLVREFIRRFQLTSEDYIFDPFCGMGTVMFGSTLEGISSVGVDKLPIAIFVARALDQMLKVNPADLYKAFGVLRRSIRSAKPAQIAEDVPLIPLAFSSEQLTKLKQLKGAINELRHPCRDILIMLFLSILEDTSLTAKDGQFLRLIKDKPVADPFGLMTAKVESALTEIKSVQSLIPPWWRSEDRTRFWEGDTRELHPSYFQKLPTCIITSPPYANRYDYTRSYCLELCFHFVRNFEELKAIRFGILRSHIEVKVGNDEKPPHPALAEVIAALQKKVLNNPRIPLMLIGYFVDMAKSIGEWSKYLAPEAKVALVVDNVRYEGEMVPVDLILTELAEAHGFTCDGILVARYKSNSSQQMARYGRRAVRESIVLWRKK